MNEIIIFNKFSKKNKIICINNEIIRRKIRRLDEIETTKMSNSLIALIEKEKKRREK